MKKWKQFLMLAVFAMVLTVAAKTDSEAAQVTGVKQTDASRDSITFSWDADLNADQYFVEVSQDNKTWIKKGYTYTTSAYIDSLSAGRSYYIRVTAYTESGAVSSSASAPLETVTAPECANMKVVQSGATATSIKLTYSNVSGANYYYVTSDNITLGASTQPTITTTRALNPATQYWVRAYATRRSASGYVASVGYYYDYMKTLSNKINTKSFGISNLYANINTYNFAVSHQGSVDGYQWQFLTMKGKVKKTVTVSSTSVSISNFIAGTFYKYRVRSYVGCSTGNAYGAWSDYRYVGMAKKFSGVASRKKIKCSWSKVASVSNYVVSISTKKNSGYKKVKTLSAKKRSITIKKCGKKKLKKGKTYYVKVLAKAKSGKKKVSSQTYWLGTVTMP